MIMWTRRDRPVRQALAALLALLVLLVVGCQSADGGADSTVEALQATISAQKAVIATMEAGAVQSPPLPTPTTRHAHQPTLSLPTPRPVSTVLRPPTATPSPLPTASPTASPTATPIPDAMVGEALTNLRGGPGVGFEILAEVDGGTPLEVLGKSADGEWIRVRIPEGLEGWMFHLPVRLNISLDAVPVAQ
jgi:uncharacterized protein YgiM (DUF1202 family)